MPKKFRVMTLGEETEFMTDKVKYRDHGIAFTWSTSKIYMPYSAVKYIQEFESKE